MRLRCLLFVALLFFGVTVAQAETLSFTPNERSISVRGSLMSERTKTYVFAAEAGQYLEMATTSRRGEYLFLRLRDPQGNEVFSNHTTGRLNWEGLLPSSGEYTLFVGLRRANSMRELRVDYLTTVTLHPLPSLQAIASGTGTYWSGEDGSEQPLEQVEIALNNNGGFEVAVRLPNGVQTLKGLWKRQLEDAALLEISECDGQPAKGQGLVFFDDEIYDEGRPTHLQLRWNTGDPSQHFDLFFGQPFR